MVRDHMVWKSSWMFNLGLTIFSSIEVMPLRTIEKAAIGYAGATCRQGLEIPLEQPRQFGEKSAQSVRNRVVMG
jgi:hypothetical protein